MAAILIGRTAGAQRFRSDASFALQSGSAPIPCSSGKRSQHRLNRGGDRQLNHALQIIAITRANHDPDTRAYLARREAEGKTKKGRSAASSATSPGASTGSSQRRRNHHRSDPTRAAPTRPPSAPPQCRWSA